MSILKKVCNVKWKQKGLFIWLSPFFLLPFEQIDNQLPSEAPSEPWGHLALRLWGWTGRRGGSTGWYWPQGDPRLGLGSHFLFGVFSVSRHAWLMHVMTHTQAATCSVFCFTCVHMLEYTCSSTAMRVAVRPFSRLLSSLLHSNPALYWTH